MLLSGLILAAILAGAFGCVVWTTQRSILFPGTRRAAPAAPDFPPELAQRYWLETTSGKVEAWYLPPPRLASQNSGADVPRTPGLLFAHGNGELIDDWLQPMRALSRLGLGVLLVEYPGYGRSQGEPSQETIGETMLAAYDALASREEIDASRIVAYGRSLGGGAVGTLLRAGGAERPLAAAILQSTFTDVPAMARSLLPVPASLIRDPLDTLDAIAHFEGPVLVAHGRQDDLIPFSHGEALAAAAPRAELLSYDCGHNDFPPDWTRYLEDLQSFLRRHDILRAPAP
jgi:fermentation-respiration switch protein FrsA (DUF1100 family)